MFGDLAPKYWEKGLSVVPLQYHSKKPIPYGWSSYSDKLPDEATQKEWCKVHAQGNIGLVLGQQSQIVVVDIDTNDPEIISLIDQCFPRSPWERIGAKGKVVAYRFNGEPTQRLDAIVNGKTTRIVEILSTGAQVVLPPSIHPDTKKPYVANADLLDVYQNLPPLGKDAMERLRVVVAQKYEVVSGATQKKFSSIEFVSTGARDTAMNRYAGFLAHAVVRGEMSVKSALADMVTWVEARVQDVKGDSLDIRKGQGQVIQYILSDIQTKNKILPMGWDQDMTEEEKKSWGFVLDETYEEWTLEQHLTHIEQFSTNLAPNSPERQKAEYLVLSKIAKSNSLTVMDVDKILNKLTKSGAGVPVATLRKQIREIKAGPVLGVSHTEIAQAIVKELVKKQGAVAYYNGKLWCYNGSHWEELKDQVVRMYIQNEYGALDLSKRGNDHKQIVNIIKDQVPQRLTVDSDDVLGVNFANGFLTRDLKLVPHSADFGMTYTLPFCYDEKLAGKFPKFDKFLTDSWGHHADFEQKKTVLQEAIAATLFGVMTSFARCVLLYGPGGAGKSVMMDVVSSLVPDEGRCALSPDKWGENFVLPNFAGKILNVAGELHESKRIDGKLFKEIISGELITTRAPHALESFVLKPKAAHWFCSNHLPKSSDASNGFNRRWLFIEFTEVVKEGDRIIDLDKQIVYEEMEAIIPWALSTFKNLMMRGDFTIPDSHKALQKDMSLQNSDIRQWLESRLVQKDGSEIAFNKVYKDYFAYCVNVLGTTHKKPKSFSIELDQLLHELYPDIQMDGLDDNKTYKGIALKELGK